MEGKQGIYSYVIRVTNFIMNRIQIGINKCVLKNIVYNNHNNIAHMEVIIV